MVKLSNKFAKHMARNEILVPYLNNWFANGKMPDEIPFTVHPNKEDDNAFHPSGALKCARELWIERQGDHEYAKHDATSQKNFMIGHMYHGLIQFIMVEELGFSKWSEVEREYDYGWDKEGNCFDDSLVTHKGNSYRIRGFADFSRCRLPGKGEYLVDIKTMMSRIYAQDFVGSANQPKYEAQVKLYMDLEDINQAIILCVEKDGPHRFKEHVVAADHDFCEDIYDKWEYVVDCEVEGVVPDCTCDHSVECPAKGFDPVGRT
jgi:hypothetical protein